MLGAELAAGLPPALIGELASRWLAIGRLDPDNLRLEYHKLVPNNLEGIRVRAVLHFKDLNVVAIINLDCLCLGVGLALRVH